MLSQISKFRLLATIIALGTTASFAHAAPNEAHPEADWRADAPGVIHDIRQSDLPQNVIPGEPEASTGVPVNVIPRPAGALPDVPEGFSVEVFADGFKMPRTLRVAPNGDIFLSESGAGRVLVFRANSKSQATPHVFAEGLDRPYGIVFHPAENPTHVYVAAADQIVRYPYRSGEVQAQGPAEVLVGDIPTERHWTRDLALSQDGTKLFISIGSASNLGASMPELSLEEIMAHEAVHGLGAAWGEEENRAVVQIYDLEANTLRNYATGLRNCSGLAMQPNTDNLWCVVNERDHLGPFLVPDFMAQVNDGDFFGWPWYYLGSNVDPGATQDRPDLMGLVKEPSVLFQAHSSSLSLAFYDHTAFPAEYQGNAFVALHGSHTRTERTGYKIVRVPMVKGQPTGQYIDFMTGFLVDNDNTWGRPAGAAVTRDGALLVSDDANGTIYRVSHN